MCLFNRTESHISEKPSNICASYTDGSLKQLTIFSLNLSFSAVLAFTLIDLHCLGMSFFLLFKFLVARLKEAFNNAKVNRDDSLRNTLILTTGEIGRYGIFFS